jgi:putative protease
MKRPEILSPAGDLERLKFAVLYGADAVYVGATEFGMRSAPKNFTMEQLAEGVRFAHARGRRVYLTLNTVPTNEEIARMPDFMRRARETGVDAFIVADLGVLAMAKHIAPEMELHVSTQAGIANYAAASAAYDLGAKRVVLARELSLNDIAVIRDNTPPELELEAFVHGAMCMSVSGRCLLSHYLTGRDANRGECTQPCRWKYHLVEEKRPGQYFPVEEDKDGTYLLNARDLCMIEHIPELISAGVTSFKIEGRAKSAYYTAVVTNAYRCAIDGYLRAQDQTGYRPEPWILEELTRVSHREYCTGFYFDKPQANAQIFYDGGYRRDWEVAAVAGNTAGGLLHAVQRNRFFRGETLSVLEAGKAPYAITVQELYDAEGLPLESAPHPMMQVRLRCEHPIAPGALLRRERKTEGQAD